MTANEHALLLDALSRCGDTDRHLEVGTAAGGTLCEMMKSLPANRRRFVVVDRMRYFDGQHDAVCRNLARHGLSDDLVDFRVRSSAQAFREATAEGETYRFVLLDAGHRLLDVMQDLMWSRLLETGGYLAVHDYDDTWSHKGVVVAVDRFMASNPNFVKVGHVERLLVLRKERAGTRPEIDWSDRCHAYARWLPLRLSRAAVKAWSRVRPDKNRIDGEGTAVDQRGQ